MDDSLDLLLQEEIEKKKKEFFNKLRKLVVFLGIEIVLLGFLLLITPKIAYYKFTLAFYVLTLLISSLLINFYSKAKKELILLLPLFGLFVLIFSLFVFNYFYWKELILVMLILIFSFTLFYYFFFRKYLKNFAIISAILFTILFAFNLVPSYLLFHKSGYYSFVYLPWNSIKLEVTYAWQQPVVGIRWKDKILENGSIIKVSEPYVKDYITHEIKETIWYNFFTRNYLVKVEGLKNESNWLVVTPRYQGNKSVANYVKCYFEIGEAPHKTVVFYENSLLNFLNSKNTTFFDDLYPFTQFKNKDEEFLLNNWKIYRPFDIIYLFKEYFVPMGSEFKENENLCDNLNVKKSEVVKIKDERGDKNEE